MSEQGQQGSETTTPRVVYLSLETLRPGQASHTHVHVIACGLSQQGLATTLFAPDLPEAAPRRGRLRALADYASLTIRALRALGGSDIAYVRAHPAALAFSLGARLMRRPVIHEVNGRTADIGVTYRLPRAVTKALTGLQHWQYRKAAALVTVTPGLADWLRQVTDGVVRVETIPNGAEGDLFRPDAPGGPPIDCPFALFFGGLVSWHGVETMLAAVRDPRWPVDWRLVVAGDGQMGAAVRAAAAEDSRIVAPGYLPRASLAGLAARAGVVLCPIEPHGARDLGGVAPLKLFEGMAAGRPVIATELPFQADLVRRHGCGLVVPPADPAALAGAVAAIAADAESATAMGRAGRHAVETLYDWRFRVAETGDLIRDLLR